MHNPNPCLNKHSRAFRHFPCGMASKGSCMCFGIVCVRSCPRLCWCCSRAGCLEGRIHRLHWLIFSPLWIERVAEGHLIHTYTEKPLGFIYFNRVHEWFSAGRFVFLRTLLQQSRASPTCFVLFFFHFFFSVLPRTRAVGEEGLHRAVCSAESVVQLPDQCWNCAMPNSAQCGAFTVCLSVQVVTTGPS